jgi:hypothetical protein
VDRTAKALLQKSPALLVFIDETSANAKLTKRRLGAEGGALPYPRALRPLAQPDLRPGLRSHGLIAPWIVEGAMNGEIFERYVETQPVPELASGDVVILDNVGFHQDSPAGRGNALVLRALVVNPEVLICDEAVAVLDVSIQAQILNLFMDLRESLD